MEEPKNRSRKDSLTFDILFISIYAIIILAAILSDHGYVKIGAIIALVDCLLLVFFMFYGMYLQAKYIE